MNRNSTETKTGISSQKAGFFALAVTILIMRFSPSLAIILLAGAAIFAAGCMQGTGPAQPVTPVPVTTSSLHELALTQSELPACFTLAEQNDKQSSEVGKLARELGWQAGHEVTFTCPAEGKEPTIIVHSLAVYPAANIPGIATMVDRQDRPGGYTYDELFIPDSHSTIRGFYGTTGGAQVYDLSASTDVLAGKSDSTEPVALSRSDVGQISVYRGTIFEVVRMTGPGTNMTLIKDIAMKVSAKIP